MTLLHKKLSVIVFWLTFTQLLVDEYIDLLTFRNFPFIPSFCSLYAKCFRLPYTIKSLFIVNKANIKFFMLFGALMKELL